MIIIVKNTDYKRVGIKVVAYGLLVLMFYFYYGHMASKFQDQNEELKKQLGVKSAMQQAQNTQKSKYEEAILEEAKKISNLVGSENIISVKIQQNRLLFVIASGTDIEPIMVRYGSAAFMQSTPQDIKIAISLDAIIKE
ncbi:MAG: hypothetical protein IE909_01650 [Campylobacterales bacterium]|nr:hypothetical protein [Campylobacterales bacterium]